MVPFRGGWRRILGWCLRRLVRRPSRLPLEIARFSARATGLDIAPRSGAFVDWPFRFLCCPFDEAPGRRERPGSRQESRRAWNAESDG